MRIAIVGAGVSGLVAAHLLHRAARRHGVRGGRLRRRPHEHDPGRHRRTKRHHVDTGFIVFNDRNYPNFERLLSALGVASQPSTMSFSVSDGSGDFEYTSASPNGLFANRAIS